MFWYMFFGTLCYAQSIESKFQAILDSVYNANPEAVGFVVHVEAPKKGISWSSAAGYSNKNTKQPLDAGQPVILASNTKTYVSATILKLVETQHFGLDDCISNLITKKSRGLLEGDGYDLNRITVRHLLSHTSGIADYVNDDYFAFVNKNLQHQWTREQQVALAVTVGSPVAPPGKKFNYADINYLLLTEIIERCSQKPFYTAISELLDFKKHGLRSTWFLDLEAPPENMKPMVHHYWDKYNWDTYDIDPSWDMYGGGGLAATMKDVALFFQLLFDGEIIKDDRLLEQMHTLVLPAEESNYCLGLRDIMFAGKAHAWYHGGFWGTDAMYVPALDASVTIVALQRDERDLNAVISAKLVDILSKE